MILGSSWTHMLYGRYPGFIKTALRIPDISDDGRDLAQDRTFSDFLCDMFNIFIEDEGQEIIWDYLPQWSFLILEWIPAMLDMGLTLKDAVAKVVLGTDLRREIQMFVGHGRSAKVPKTTNFVIQMATPYFNTEPAAYDLGREEVAGSVTETTAFAGLNSLSKLASKRRGSQSRE